MTPNIISSHLSELGSDKFRTVKCYSPLVISCFATVKLGYQVPVPFSKLAARMGAYIQRVLIFIGC